MKSAKRILLCVVIMVAAFAACKVDPAFAMQKIDFMMLPDTGGVTSLNDMCEYEIPYAKGDQIHSFTDEYGTTYKGEVIALDMESDGKAVFFSVGGYATGYQEVRLFQDAQLTDEVWNMNYVHDYLGPRTISKELKKGTYYLFNGTCNANQIGGGEDGKYSYTIRGAYMINGTPTIESGKKYTFTGENNCAKIVLDKSRNICLKTALLGNVKILNSSKNVIYDIDADYFSRAGSYQYVFLKKGTYYVEFEEAGWAGNGQNGFDYGYIQYDVMNWSDWGLSEAKNLKTQRGVPIMFRYRPTYSGYITFSSPRNYNALIEMYDSSFKKIGKNDYADGCGEEKACFVVEKGKTYYFKATQKMIYCDQYIKLNYSIAKNSTCWGGTRTAAKSKSAITGTVKGTWQYGCTKPLWVKVKKPNDYQALLLYLDLNRYSKCTVQAYNSKGKLVKISKGTGRYTKLKFSRTKSGWGHEGFYVHGNKGTYYLKITPVDGACGKLKLKPVPKR